MVTHVLLKSLVFVQEQEYKLHSLISNNSHHAATFIVHIVFLASSQSFYVLEYNYFNFISMYIMLCSSIFQMVLSIFFTIFLDLLTLQSS